MTGVLHPEISIGDKVGHTTVLALLRNKHGQKCAIVECFCGERILRILATARRGSSCRKCSLRAVGRSVFGAPKTPGHAVHPSRCAARYARLARCSISEAALVFGVNPGAAWNAWERIYPDLPQPISDKRRQSTCTACGVKGHVAVLGKCSPSELAYRLVQGGMTPKDAADQIGIERNAVYGAIAHRRRVA